MTRLILSLPFALAACASGPAPIPPPDAEVRPVVIQDDLRGRWSITSVNGKPVDDPWLELGGEGPAAITKTDRGIMVGSPQPPTRAYLGCNDLHLNGWTRNGDKLSLGSDMASKTERGCGPEREAVEDQIYAILMHGMTMELTPPNTLRLISEHGTLDLIRAQD